MKEPGSDQRRENEMAFDLAGRWQVTPPPQKCKVVWEPVRIGRGGRFRGGGVGEAAERRCSAPPFRNRLSPEH